MTDLHPSEAAYFNAVRPGNGWHAQADRAVAQLAKAGAPFTNEDVRRLVDDSPSHPNAWGGLYRYWAGRGLIRHIGFTKSTTAGRHGAAVGVWQGTQQQNIAA